MVVADSYPCSSHWGRWSQDLSPGLGELDVLRLHLAVLSLRSPFPLGADEDGWLQGSGWHTKVLYVCALSWFKRLMGNLIERWAFREEKVQQVQLGHQGGDDRLPDSEVKLPVFCLRWWTAHWFSFACKYHFSPTVSCEASLDASLSVLDSSPYDEKKQFKFLLQINF